MLQFVLVVDHIFNSVAVAVTSTASFIFGEVKVLLVSV
jgi:hypothetical protein